MRTQSVWPSTSQWSSNRPSTFPAVAFLRYRVPAIPGQPRWDRLMSTCPMAHIGWTSPCQLSVGGTNVSMSPSSPMSQVDPPPPTHTSGAREVFPQAVLPFGMLLASEGLRVATFL